MLPFEATEISGYQYLDYWSHCLPDTQNRKRWTLHPGVDLVGVNGDRNVRSIGNGIVRILSNKDDTGFGRHLEVDHTLPDGVHIYTQYVHLDSIWVEDGQFVQMGDILGIMGATGKTLGAHLEFNMRTAPYDASFNKWPEQFCTAVLTESFVQQIATWTADFTSDLPRFLDPLAFIEKFNIQDRVTLYTHTYLRGQSIELFDEGIYAIPEGFVYFSSLTVPSGWCVQFDNSLDRNHLRQTVPTSDMNLADNQFSDGASAREGTATVHVAQMACPDIDTGTQNSRRLEQPLAKASPTMTSVATMRPTTMRYEQPTATAIVHNVPVTAKPYRLLWYILASIAAIYSLLFILFWVSHRKKMAYIHL